MGRTYGILANRNKITKLRHIIQPHFALAQPKALIISHYLYSLWMFCWMLPRLSIFCSADYSVFFEKLANMGVPSVMARFRWDVFSSKTINFNSPLVQSYSTSLESRMVYVREYFRQFFFLSTWMHCYTLLGS